MQPHEPHAYAHRAGVGVRVVNARDAIARAEALGVRLRLETDGQVKLAAAAPPPADLLAELRLCRDDVVRLLAERRRPAWADIAPEPPRRVYQPGDPDPLRDGLLASARRHLPPLPSAARGRGISRADGE